MTSLNVMWAATSHQVFRSVDAGRHWSDVTPARAAHDSRPFFALNDQDAWFVDTAFGPGSPYDVWRSTDGGTTWSESRGTAPGYVMGISFVDRFHGWMTVSGGAAAGSQAVAVMRSVDGGATWSLVAKSTPPDATQPDPSGLEFGCDKGTATFASASVGLLPTVCAGGAPYIYRTADGGIHWHAIALPIPNGVQETGGSFAGPIVLTTTDAVMGGGYYSTTFFAAMVSTHDAGASWREYGLPGQGSLDFESTSSGWILTDPIRATTDGGASWHALGISTPPFQPTDMTLQFLGRGIAVAWSGQRAFRTDDGGRTWKSIAPVRPLI